MGFSEKTSDDASISAGSQGESVGRHRRLRSAAGYDSETSGSGSSWLRRISMISSLSGSPASSRPHTPSGIPSARYPGQPNTEMSNRLPNKLVKRSSSQRALTSDRGLFHLKRRPTTSHQPSFESTKHPFPSQTGNVEANSSLSWRPYFHANLYQPRKRHTAGATRERTIRTISDVRGTRPTLLLGTNVKAIEDIDQDDVDDHPPLKNPIPQPLIRRKRAATGATGRRAFTDPVVRRDVESNAFAEESHTSPLSPISPISTFDINVPISTPAFSDPTTTNSDQVFTDDDSMDFQSDTAYDSLATRATASSHSGLRGLQIESVFEEAGETAHGNTLLGLEELIREGSLEKHPYADSLVALPHQGSFMNPDRRLNASPDENDVILPQLPSSTPPKRSSIEEDDPMATPVPKRKREASQTMDSSPPSITTPRPKSSSPLKEEDQMMLASKFETDELDWMLSNNAGSVSEGACTLPDMPDSPNWDVDYPRGVSGRGFKALNGRSEKRTSIFDWSEHHKRLTDILNGSSPRPKTVHGRQEIELRGSRPPGRRGPGALHLRSQSVPVTREHNHEVDAVRSSAKFGTWGLGNKGVSEEWSDDFEFEDTTTTSMLEIVNETSVMNPFGSVRTMRVPQSIIDRQASVHGQFGQVQELMLLVEELKRLRIQGSMLQLLEDSQSKLLWEDAESIVNLATLNDDDGEEARPPQSPGSRLSFDTFDDELSTPQRIERQSSKHTLDDSDTKCSGTVTPQAGRARGESLAHARSLLEDFHQKRNGPDSSPAEIEIDQQKKLPFDTQDLRDLVVRAGVVTRALKEVVRKAEGVTVSPVKSQGGFQDPPFSQIFNRPDISPSLSAKRVGITKSRSANSYLGGVAEGGNESELSSHMRMLTVI